jgi:hypothetical protein
VGCTAGACVCTRALTRDHMPYEEEDTCVSYAEDTCVSYEEEDTSVSYEEGTCVYACLFT